MNLLNFLPLLGTASALAANFSNEVVVDFIVCTIARLEDFRAPVITDLRNSKLSLYGRSIGLNNCTAFRRVINLDFSNPVVTLKLNNTDFMSIMSDDSSFEGCLPDRHHRPCVIYMYPLSRTHQVLHNGAIKGEVAYHNASLSFSGNKKFDPKQFDGNFLNFLKLQEGTVTFRRQLPNGINILAPHSFLNSDLSLKKNFITVVNLSSSIFNTDSLSCDSMSFCETPVPKTTSLSTSIAFDQAGVLVVSSKNQDVTQIVQDFYPVQFKNEKETFSLAVIPASVTVDVNANSPTTDSTIFSINDITEKKELIELQIASSSNRITEYKFKLFILNNGGKHKGNMKIMFRPYQIETPSENHIHSTERFIFDPLMNYLPVKINEESQENSIFSLTDLLDGVSTTSSSSTLRI